MPTVEEALQIGWKQHQAGDLRGAETVYRQVIAAAPANENAWCFLGMACHDQARYDEAHAAYREALRIKPNFPVALSNLGNTLKQQGKLDEAEASCREALRYKPDYSTAYNNLGVALVAQGRLEDAAATFERALQLMPTDAVAHANLGAALVRQGRFDEGTEIAQKALKINPNYAEAHKNQAIVWLLLADFARGWPEYEWRWRCPGSPPPAIAAPRWNGESVAARTILLHWEQGLGDTIQFARYARYFKRQGARVLLCCHRPLRKLMERCEGVDHVVPQGDPLPPFDYWIPLLSIPGVLKTDLASIPADVGYLTADPALVETWRGRLAEFPGFRVGIAWQGSPDFHADRQRSIPLSFFERLAKLPGVRLISLQKGVGTEQLAQLGSRFDVVDFGDELDASGPFLDTAAIMQGVDLVVSSDTSVPHLAGALGVPTWIGLSVSPDWRWLLKREDSPWYPTMRLFRQSSLGDWEGVFERIEQSLRETLAKTPQLAAPMPVAPLSIASARVLSTGFNCLTQARHGPMLFNQHDMYIGRSIDLYGEFSEEEVEMFGHVLRAGDLVVEAGANIGVHTVAIAKLVGAQGTVFAFEPQRLVFQTLCANVALNSLANVHARHQALGAEPGQIFVPLLDAEKETNFGGLGLGQYQRGERVPVATVDGLELPICRLIKIDVEGMELSVLQGAAATLRRCWPALYVENDREEKSAALIGHLQTLGYRLFWHTPRMFRESNFHRNRHNAFGQIVSVNMLCIHETDATKVDGLRTVEGPSSRWNEP